MSKVRVLAIAPVLLGSGERFFADIDLLGLGYRCTEHVATQKATHIVLSRPLTPGNSSSPV